MKSKDTLVILLDDTWDSEQSVRPFAKLCREKNAKLLKVAIEVDNIAEAVSRNERRGQSVPKHFVTGYRNKVSNHVIISQEVEAMATILDSLI
mmetsp:Transcript_15469/g.7486  ORF Transcript_15469/g.7486 Transcript_15469/m.7486 type:complete len:93 (-) Transcript_15469:106-384(-)